MAHQYMRQKAGSSMDMWAKDKLICEAVKALLAKLHP